MDEEPVETPLPETPPVPLVSPSCTLLTMDIMSLIATCACRPLCAVTRGAERISAPSRCSIALIVIRNCGSVRMPVMVAKVTGELALEGAPVATLSRPLVKIPSEAAGQSGRGNQSVPAPGRCPMDWRAWGSPCKKAPCPPARQWRHCSM